MRMAMNSYQKAIHQRSGLPERYALWIETALIERYRILNGLSKTTIDSFVDRCVAREKTEPGWLRRNHNLIVGAFA